MTLPILIPPTVAVAGLPRVFLHSEIPGYLSEEGTLCLPMKLDPEPVNTGVPANDDDRIAEFYFRNASRFAQENPEFQLRPNREAYFDQIRPPWMRSLMGDVDRIIGRYERTYAGQSPTVIRRVLEPLWEGWSEVKDLIAASIYLGNGGLSEDEYLIYPHELLLEGTSPTSLYGLLRFLEKYKEALSLLRTGMTDIIMIRRPGEDGEGEEVRQLLDPMTGQPDPAFEYVELSGIVRSQKKGEVRPIVMLDADAEGDIDLVQYVTGNISGAYLGFQDFAFRQTQIFLGLFLCAYYRLGQGEIEGLMGETKVPVGRRFEGQEKDFQARLVSSVLTTLRALS